LSFLRNEEIDNLVNDYTNELKQYKKYVSDLNELNNKITENSLKEDYLKYQLNELNKANLSVEEESELLSELKILSNSEKMKSLISIIKDTLTNGDLLSNLYESINALDKLSTYDERFNELKKITEEAYYNLEDVSNDKLLSSNLYDFDERRFNEINDRLGLYSDLKRKYKKNVNELVEYQEKLRIDLESIGNFELLKDSLNKNISKSYNNTLELANKIRHLRKNNAIIIENTIKQHLLDLQLNNAKFEILFNEINEIVFNKDGIDAIDFLVSFNKGEPLKSLSKTASGGELSRFMLALKTILGDKLPMQTKIFDEIDSGVSGNIAYSIGKKLQEISKNSQVLCITHLPQVASLANNHLKISKEISDNRTFTKIKLLDYSERITEIASMISNNNISEASLKYAEELLKNQ